MDPKLKNLREWVGLLFALFCVLGLAGLQYGMILAATAPDHPAPLTGQVIAMAHGARGLSTRIYISPAQLTTFYGFLGGGVAALIAAFAIVIAHGMRLTWAPRK